MLLRSLIEDFASPSRDTSASGRRDLARAFYLAALSRWSKRASPHLLEVWSESIEFARSAARLSERSAWVPELGASLRAMASDSLDEAACHLVCAAASLGVNGSASFYLPQRTATSCGGHLFEVSGKVCVETSGSTVTIRTDTGEIILVMDSGQTFSCGAIKTSPSAFLSGKANLYICAFDEERVQKADHILHWPPSVSAGPVDLRLAEAETCLHRAVDVLTAAGPAYVPWVASMLRGIAASEAAGDDMMQSASYTWHAGVVACGFPLHEEAVAEILVHEVSHQHFLLLNPIHPLVDKADSRLYWSALKGSARPLSRTLLAFHATVNMTQFWNDLIARQGLTLRREEGLRKMLSFSSDLADAIGSANGLTEAGAEFVSHLNAGWRAVQKDALVSW